MTDQRTAQLRRLGATDLFTPPLVLGGNVFGWTADKATSFRILDAFVDGGGTLVDTADVYSAWAPGHRGGESESVIGEWLAASGKRGKVQVATKVGMLPGEGGEKLAPARIAAACEASLKRLGVEAIDLYFAHQDDADTPQEASLEAFGRLVDAGKVRVIGASNFHAGRLKSALDVARDRGLPHYHVLQPEYNLVSRHAFEGELQDLCVAHNIGVIPYFGLASGFLTGKYRSEADAAKSRRGAKASAHLAGKGKPVLAAMDAVAAETGATSVEQLEELLGAIDLTLSADQLDRLTFAGA